jgi:hypothetical protein
MGDTSLGLEKVNGFLKFRLRDFGKSGGFRLVGPIINGVPGDFFPPADPPAAKTAIPVVNQ